MGREDRYKDIDPNIAANVRAYREACGVSQEELAGRVADRDFPFSQATIWKVENGQRPLKAAELVAVADALEIRSPISLTLQPDAARHLIDLQRASAHASAVWHAVKDAAAAYLAAQLDLVVAARQAHDAGLTVTALHTSWLTTTPEEAVIQARVDSEDEATRSEGLDNRVNKILAALRANNYEPHLRIEDVEIRGGGDLPVPVWTPDGDSSPE